MTVARAGRPEAIAREVTARGAGMIRGVGRGLRAVARRVVSAWRASLQLRVGATTVVVTGIVVLIIGIFIVDRVADGILHAKEQAAVNQAQSGRNAAQTTLQSVDDPSLCTDVTDAERTIRGQVTGRGASAGRFTVSLTSPICDRTDVPLPGGLRDQVRKGDLALQYGPVSLGAKQVPGLLVGLPAGNQFALYYLFPLTAEQQTIALVQRTVLFAGLALVILVLGIALLVTRQVVRPVRVAARTAGRLAGGDLAQRIPTKGTDDIALLGKAFNEMADSLQRQFRRLEDLSRLQRRFTSDVSHELRTPLTTIRMASEYLYGRRTDFPPEVARSAELLHTELDRFESLLADLLEISRYDAGVAHLESEPADIRLVVASTVAANQMLARRHGSELVVDAPNAPVVVDMDARRVERILRNLVANALDHGDGKPVVTTIGFDDDAVAVTVRDHGIGLRPGEAGLVFNRFWRGDTSRSRLTGGTGLGLSISLEDARLHDGWLQAWGERGRGAQFRLTLPRRAGHTLLHSPLPLDPDETNEDDE